MLDLKSSSQQGLRDLLDWAMRLEWADVPDAARRQAALVVVDDIAAMIAAHAEAECAAMAGRLAASDRGDEATLFAPGRGRTSRRTAALVNGTAANWCELDEGYRKIGCHAGLYTVPALLAEAEAEDRPVVEVMRALVGAYEIVARFARTWRQPYPASVHPHAKFAAVGAAAAVCLLRRVDAATFERAITAASTLINAGPYRHAVDGALVENAWAGVGAVNGFLAADLAACGIGGIGSSPWEAYVDALGAEAFPEELTAGLGAGENAEWAIADGYHKIHSCCQHAHSTVEAIVPLVERELATVGAERIRAIDVEIHKLGIRLDDRNPVTTLGGRFSIPHVVATTVLHGHAGQAAFGPEALARTDVAALRAKVNLKPWEPELPPPHDRPSRVTITFDDGRTVRGECLSARGGPDLPFPTEAILDKVERLGGASGAGLRRLGAGLMAGDATLFGAGWRTTAASL